MSEEMIRRDILDSIKDYFRGEQWMRLETKIETDSVTTYHAHIFVDTRLHPLSFCEVLRAYYRAKGLEIDRPIDLQPSNVGHNMLHGIHPTGCFHFDLAWKYNRDNDAMIKPMDPQFIKEKNNLQIWGKKEIDEFFAQYAFVKPEGKVKEDLDAYFESDNWEEAKKLVVNPDMVHFHMNVETSIHPDYIQKKAREVMEQEGWTIQKTFHCIFSPYKGWTTGKIVYLMDTPRVMWDIAWKFNENVTIIPSTVPFMGVDPENNRFDIRWKHGMNFFTDGGEFVELTNAEIRKLEEEWKAE